MISSPWSSVRKSTSELGSNGDYVASMAWGARNVISTQVVLRVHDFDYLSRVATHVEALQRAESGVSEATETKRTLLRCVSTTLTGDTFACARSLHAALCASYTVCKAIDTVVRGEYRNAFCVVRPPGHHAGQSGSTRKDQKAPDEDEPGLVGQGFCLINHVAVGASA